MNDPDVYVERKRRIERDGSRRHEDCRWVYHFAAARPVRDGGLTRPGAPSRAQPTVVGQLLLRAGRLGYRKPTDETQGHEGAEPHHKNGGARQHGGKPSREGERPSDQATPSRTFGVTRFGSITVTITAYAMRARAIHVSTFTSLSFGRTLRMASAISRITHS